MAEPSLIPVDSRFRGNDGVGLPSIFRETHFTLTPALSLRERGLCKGRISRE